MSGRMIGQCIRRMVLLAAVTLALMAVPVAAYAAGATVQGRLTDASTSAVLEGCAVELWSYSHATGWVLADVTISGADGGYVFSDVAPATYDVEAVEIGYRWGWSYAFAITGTETRTANVALSPIVPALPAISGSVVDSSTGQPLVGAQVDVYYLYGPGTWDVWDRVLTDGSGEYEVHGLPPTTFRVGYTLAGYAAQFYSEAATVGAASDVVYDGSTERAGIDASLVPVAQSSELTGTVLDASTGLPLSGALVVAKDPVTGVRQTNDFADAAGSYAVGVPDRAMRVEVSSAGHERLVLVTPALAAGSYELSVWLGTGIGSPSVAIGGVADAGEYLATVTPRAWVATSSVAVTATMDGAPFDLGEDYRVEGDHELVVIADDGSGTSTATLHFRIGDSGEAPHAVGGMSFDQTPPVVTITGVENNGVYAAGVTPSASTDDPSARMWAVLDSVPYALSTPIVVEGLHIFEVAATDSAGNSDWSQVRFEVDATPPTLSVTGVEDGGVYLGAVTPAVITSDSADIVRVTLDGDPFVPGSRVERAGTHVLTVIAEDGVGNAASVVVAFEIVAQPSALSIEVLPSRVTYPQPVTIAGTLSVDPAAARESYEIRFRSQTPTGWIDVAGLRTTAGATGVFSLGWTPSMNTTLQAVYDGEGALAGSVSAPRRVGVAAAVGLFAPTTARAGRAFSARVTLAPAHGSVRVTVARRVSGAWVAYRSYTLNTASGSALRRLTLSAGDYRLVATHADAGHLTSSSTPRIVRVR